MDDFLAAEPLIVACLQAALNPEPAEGEDKPPVINVFAARDLATVQESGQITPAVHVLLDSFEADAITRDGKAQQITQRWLVVIVVRSADGVRAGEGVKASAGPLIVRTFNALAGWEPPGGDFSPLLHVTPPARPDYSPGGFMYFPLAFTTSCVMRTT